MVSDTRMCGGMRAAYAGPFCSMCVIMLYVYCERASYEYQEHSRTDSGRSIIAQCSRGALSTLRHAAAVEEGKEGKEQQHLHLGIYCMTFSSLKDQISMGSVHRCELQLGA